MDVEDKETVEEKQDRAEEIAYLERCIASNARDITEQKIAINNSAGSSQELKRTLHMLSILEKRAREYAEDIEELRSR